MTGQPGARRVIFVNRFFWPDHSATSQMLTDVAFGLVGQGHAIMVITSRLSYDDQDMRFAARETVNGVDVRRVFTSGFGRSGLAGRAVDYLSFYLSSTLCVLLMARRNDVVVVKTDPPLLSIPVRLACWLRSARQVNWLQDIYPEVAAKLGVTLASGVFGRWLGAVRSWSFRSSAGNVVIGQRMSELVTSLGVDSSAVHVIPNFADDQAIQPLEPAQNPLRSEWGYTDHHLVVGYSGNLGRAHDIDTIISAARALQEQHRTTIRFLFIGGGHLRQQLESKIREFGLTNIDVRPYQPREMLPQSLSVPDLHWMTLLPELEGLIVPSKLYGALAAGRPVLFVGAAGGEISEILKDKGAGWQVTPYNHDQLVDILTALAQNPETLKQAGRAARALIDGGLSRQHAFDQWDRLITSI